MAYDNLESQPTTFLAKENVTTIISVTPHQLQRTTARTLQVKYHHQHQHHHHHHHCTQWIHYGPEFQVRNSVWYYSQPSLEFWTKQKHHKTEHKLESNMIKSQLYAALLIQLTIESISLKLFFFLGR